MENARAAILAHSKPSTWDMTRQQQFLAPRCLKNCRRARKFLRARKAHSRLKRACLELQSKALRLILSAARGNSFLSPIAEERQHFLRRTWRRPIVSSFAGVASGMLLRRTKKICQRILGKSSTLWMNSHPISIHVEHLLNRETKALRI